mgnify:CR=1 FL=1
MVLNKVTKLLAMIAVAATLATGVLYTINKNKNLEQLKKQYPALAIVSDSLKTVIVNLDETRRYIQAENYVGASNQLDQAEEILNKKRINEAILDSLVNKKYISSGEKKEVILLKAQVDNLRKEITEGLARQKNKK